MFQSDDDDVAQSFRRPKLLKYSSHTTARQQQVSIHYKIGLSCCWPGRPALFQWPQAIKPGLNLKLIYYSLYSDDHDLGTAAAAGHAQWFIRIHDKDIMFKVQKCLKNMITGSVRTYFRCVYYDFANLFGFHSEFGSFRNFDGFDWNLDSADRD